MMKALLKAVARGMAAFVVLPAVGLYGLERLAFGPERVFPGWSQAFALIPGLTGEYLRAAFYRWTLAGCGEDACIGFGTVFSQAGARIGRGVCVGAYCVLGDVTLEDDVLLASGVSVSNGASQHGIARLDVPIREQPGIWPRVTIGRDCWIGERAVVLADVGPQCVVGAGAVVVKPIPECTIAVGVPARVVRRRESIHSLPPLSS